MAIPLDEIFLEQQINLIVQSYINASSILSDTQRTWMMPALLQGKPFDPSWPGHPYTRNFLNLIYPVINIFRLGSTGDAMACKIQADYLSAQERAFRLRHASHIRCLVHSAGRKMAHTDLNAGVLIRPIAYVQDLISSGSR